MTFLRAWTLGLDWQTEISIILRGCAPKGRVIVKRTVDMPHEYEIGVRNFKMEQNEKDVDVCLSDGL